MRMFRSVTSPQLEKLLDGSIDPRRLVKSQSVNSLLHAKLQKRSQRRRRLVGVVSGLRGPFRHFLAAVSFSVILLYIGRLCRGTHRFTSSVGGGHRRDGLVAAAFTKSAEMLEALRVDPSTGDIDAIGFLDAVDELTPALHDLGTLFSLASSPVYGNAAKLRKHTTEKCGEGPGECTLQKMVLAEVSPSTPPTKPMRKLLPPRSLPEPSVDSEGPFTVLRWASFSLHFIEGILRRVASEELRDRPMSDCVSDAYEHILRPHHGPFLASISKSILRVVPVSRSIITEKTGLTEGESAKVMVRWADSYARIRPAIDRFYEMWPEHRP